MLLTDPPWHQHKHMDGRSKLLQMCVILNKYVSWNAHQLFPQELTTSNEYVSLLTSFLYARYSVLAADINTPLQRVYFLIFEPRFY